MAKLTAAHRNALSTGSFAGPDRSYPIPDASHARNALSRASQFASPGEKAQIRSKVHAKFPGIGKSAAGGHHPRMHALAMASATHLHNLGHISSGQHKKIHSTAKRAISSYGSIAPRMPKYGSGHYMSTPTPTADDESGGGM